VAAELAENTGAGIWMHPDDEVLWRTVYPDRLPDKTLHAGQTIRVAGTALEVLHTPGHAPGAVCLYAPELAALFSGDTLFSGGPGATGRSYSDFPTIIDSIRNSLLVLPQYVSVFTGHGDTTTIGAESQHVDDWITRGR
jgi:glyoxylase-like metal-dependent hydrolase (beta-lactamase superfamily II)